LPTGTPTLPYRFLTVKPQIAALKRENLMENLGFAQVPYAQASKDPNFTTLTKGWSKPQAYRQAFDGTSVSVYSTAKGWVALTVGVQTSPYPSGPIALRALCAKLRVSGDEDYKKLASLLNEAITGQL